MTIPDGMPLLKRGAQRDPRDGACVMQYISVLFGERFSAMPRAVDPHIATWSWHLNDACPSDALRADLLMPLIPRLMRTYRIPLERGEWIDAQFEAAKREARQANWGCVGPWEAAAAGVRLLAGRLVEVLDALEPELLDDPELDPWTPPADPFESVQDEPTPASAHQSMERRPVDAEILELRNRIAELRALVGERTGSGPDGPDPVLVPAGR